MPLPNPTNHHLLPHLREVCAILAAGLVRLRSRADDDLARNAAQAEARGDICLHSTARQRRHANPRRKGVA
jgi:hypothetical protein